MKNIIRLIILLSIFGSSCQKGNEQAGEYSTQEISDSLKNIAVEFLRSWEPPFYPDKAISLFTESKDFYLVIDGNEIETFQEWSAGVPNYMSDDNYFFSSYKHEIKDIRTVVLSPESGVVTIVYIWDNVSTDGIHRRVNGAATLACRKEENRWKIVHYHGSHLE